MFFFPFVKSQKKVGSADTQKVIFRKFLFSVIYTFTYHSSKRVKMRTTFWKTFTLCATQEKHFLQKYEK